MKLEDNLDAIRIGTSSFGVKAAWYTQVFFSQSMALSVDLKLHEDC